MTWSPEGEGSPLNRRDSVVSLSTPPLSSSVDLGMRGDFVGSFTTPPHPAVWTG